MVEREESGSRQRAIGEDDIALLPSVEDRTLFVEELSIFLAAMYPGCPEAWRAGLIERAATRGHFGRLGEIAGILTDTSARHQATDYDALQRINGRGEGLTREEARMVVADEVRDVVEGWRQGSAEEDTGYRELRKTLRRKRMKKGSRKNNLGVVAHENAVVASYLRGWLDAQRKAFRQPETARSIPED